MQRTFCVERSTTHMAQLENISQNRSHGDRQAKTDVSCRLRRGSELMRPMLKAFCNRKSIAYVCTMPARGIYWCVFVCTKRDDTALARVARVARVAHARTHVLCACPRFAPLLLITAAIFEEERAQTSLSRAGVCMHASE